MTFHWTIGNVQLTHKYVKQTNKAIWQMKHIIQMEWLAGLHNYGILLHAPWQNILNSHPVDRIPFTFV